MSNYLPNGRIKPVGDLGILVEFGDEINDQIHNRVLELYRNLKATPFAGITEIIPSYASVFIGYDSLSVHYREVCNHIENQLEIGVEQASEGQIWQIPTCYEGEYAPDLAELSDNLDMPAEEVIQKHLEGQYKVYMYGFAPGYAYMGGVPEAIQYARKQVPKMDVPSGCVMIAGPQCLITTMKMPSGWWVIGRTATQPLQAYSDKPFLFGVGDKIEFLRVTEREFKNQDHGG